MSLKCKQCNHVKMKCYRKEFSRTMTYTVRCPKCKVWYDISDHTAFVHFPNIVRAHFGRQKND